MGATNLLYPTPVTLVGTIVGGKPNFITIAHIGIIEYSPVHIISLSMNKRHYSNEGIQNNKCFSVNLPATKMLEITDYVGIYSGRKIDKSNLFNVFFGELENAPMVRECPINMECRLYQTHDIHKHWIYIGEVVASYCDESTLTEGVPDQEKINPILFSFYDKSYWKLGGKIGKAWNVGKDWRKQP